MCPRLCRGDALFSAGGFHCPLCLPQRGETSLIVGGKITGDLRKNLENKRTWKSFLRILGSVSSLSGSRNLFYLLDSLAMHGFINQPSGVHDSLGIWFDSHRSSSHCLQSGFVTEGQGSQSWATTTTCLLSSPVLGSAPRPLPLQVPQPHFECA